jgi:hypothetical protein
MWILEYLKKMEDLSSDFYKIAVAKDIPDGLARRFKKDLIFFKSE